LLVRGAIPGSKNGDVMVYPAVKTARVGKPAAKPVAAKAGK
jgi:ribosomal protein L3